MFALGEEPRPPHAVIPGSVRPASRSILLRNDVGRLSFAVIRPIISSSFIN